jgi:hypothetical protein
VPEAVRAVARGIDRESFRLQATRDEGKDSGLVLDYQDSHRVATGTLTRHDLKMTGK